MQRPGEGTHQIKWLLIEPKGTIADSLSVLEPPCSSSSVNTTAGSATGIYTKAFKMFVVFSRIVYLRVHSLYSCIQCKRVFRSTNIIQPYIPSRPL